MLVLLMSGTYDVRHCDDLGGIIHITSFIKIGSSIQKLIGGVRREYLRLALSKGPN
jgi:hypothetical protein